MSYDIQPFGSIFLNNNEDNEVTKHAPGAIPRMSDVKKKKRRRNAKKARRRAQAEAERREYDTWVVAMYKKNKEEQILKEKEEGLRNLIEQSVSDSNSQFNNSKYNNPIPPPQRPRNSKFMSGKSIISNLIITKYSEFTKLTIRFHLLLAAQISSWRTRCRMN